MFRAFVFCLCTRFSTPDPEALVAACCGVHMPFGDFKRETEREAETVTSDFPFGKSEPRVRERGALERC